MVGHRFAQAAHWAQDHIRPIVERDSRPLGIRAVDAVPIDPNVRVSEPVKPAAAAGGQPAAMEVSIAGRESSATLGGVGGTTGHSWSCETCSRNTIDAKQC